MGRIGPMNTVIAHARSSLDVIVGFSNLHESAAARKGRKLQLQPVNLAREAGLR
jgi:hypothetical protein